MSHVTHLHLIRHGEVAGQYHRVFGGSRIDMDLSPKGHEQARLLADYVRRHKIDAVFASPMLRVQQTLAPLRGHYPNPVVILDDLREVDFGDWTGLTWVQVKDRFGTSAYDWLDHLEAGTIPNGENSAALQGRVDTCLRAILQKHAGQSIAIYCHGGIVRALLSLLVEIPLPKLAYFNIDYASITQVEIDENGVEVQLLNFTPWRHL